MTHAVFTCFISACNTVLNVHHGPTSITRPSSSSKHVHHDRLHAHDRPRRRQASSISSSTASSLQLNLTLKVPRFPTDADASRPYRCPHDGKTLQTGPSHRGTSHTTLHSTLIDLQRLVEPRFRRRRAAAAAYSFKTISKANDSTFASTKRATRSSDVGLRYPRAAAAISTAKQLVRVLQHRPRRTADLDNFNSLSNRQFESNQSENDMVCST